MNVEPVRYAPVMIVKFLYTQGPNGHFPAVGYNTGKMDRNKGELMKVVNFGPLQGLGHLRPQDYKNYLKMVSATNKAVKKPQLHVAISAEGRSYNKHELTQIATQWLERMGYGKQPYLLIFHKDTRNNHIHVVSTRVDKQGKKIRDSFEQIRGLEQMNIVMGLNEKHNAKADVAKALAYQFATKAQFMMILESRGYTLKAENSKLVVIKFGKRQDEIGLTAIEEKLAAYAPDTNRKVQLKALFHKYAAAYDTAIEKNRGVYTSVFAGYLKEKFGIDLVFHASGDKPPYGYTIIDHAEKQVFKGGEIMALTELLAVEASVEPVEEQNVLEEQVLTEPGDDFSKYYAAILKATLYNYPDFSQGLHHQGLTITRRGEEFYLNDAGAGVTMDTADLLDEKDYRFMVEQFSQYAEIEEEVYRQHVYISEPNIAPDIDDEAINGRNRRRKKKARTNTR
jgi:hypothetical protein